MGRAPTPTPTARRAPGRILFVSHDGMTDPLGRSQVLPYLVGLSAKGHEITLLSCEKPARRARDAATIERICRDAGIDWRPIAYRNRPPVLGPMLNIAALKRAARRLHDERNFDVIHARSYVGATVAMDLKRRSGVSFLFDMRGFWPDERVEGNVWDLSNPVFRAIYAYYKRLEAQFLARADHIVSLTEEGRRIVAARPETRAPITVIPCCVDFDHFALVTEAARAAARTELDIAPERKVVAYLGSLGTWYMLDEMLDFFAIYRGHEPGALLFFITQDDPQPIVDAAAARGITRDALLIRPASREQVPRFLEAADYGLFFIKPVFSKKASSPTKMGELLAMGLPVVTNTGVGDVDEILHDVEGGAVTARFDVPAYEAAIAKLRELKALPAEIRRNGLAWFDVKTGIARYHAVYVALIALNRDTSRGA